MAYYTEKVELIPNCLSIYRSTQTKKGWWSAYIKIKGHPRERRSLKTTSKREAEAKAVSLYYKMRSLAEEGLPIKATSWNDLRKRYRNAVDYADSTENRLRMLDIFYGEFNDIKEINTEFIGQYEKKRLNYWSTPEGKRHAKKNNCHNYNTGETTLRMEMTTLNAILKWAFMRGLIPFVPEIGFFRKTRRYGINYNTRGEITPTLHRKIWQYLDNEYKALLRRQSDPPDTSFYHAKRRLINKTGNNEVTDDEVRATLGRKNIIKNRRMWIYYHCMHKGWMIRCSEWRQLKWHNISTLFYDELGKDVLEVEIPKHVSKNKRNRNAYIIDYDTVHGDVEKEGTLIRMLKQWHEITPYGEDDDFIFCNIDERGDRNTAAMMNVYFGKLLKRLDIRTDDDGRRLTAYSLRHAGISNAIRNGVDVFKISKAADTSPTQIRKHYSKLFDEEVIEDFVEAERRNKVRLGKKKRREIRNNLIYLENIKSA